MEDTLTVGNVMYPVAGYADDGLPIIKAATSSRQDGFDEHGNPRISVEVKVPSILVGATPGEVA